jgi:hypothetical protein
MGVPKEGPSSGVVTGIVWKGLWGLPSRATSIALAAVEEGNAWNLELA